MEEWMGALWLPLGTPEASQDPAPSGGCQCQASGTEARPLCPTQHACVPRDPVPLLARARGPLPAGRPWNRDRLPWPVGHLLVISVHMARLPPAKSLR